MIRDEPLFFRTGWKQNNPNKLFARKTKQKKNCQQKMQLEKIVSIRATTDRKKFFVLKKISSLPPSKKNNGQFLSKVCQITFMNTIENWAADGEERTLGIFYLSFRYTIVCYTHLSILLMNLTLQIKTGALLIFTSPTKTLSSHRLNQFFSPANFPSLIRS